MNICKMSEKLQYTDIQGEMADILKKYFICDFRSGYIRCKDVVLPNYFKCFGDAIQEFAIRADDVWVCSFPKSGTTWVQEMVWCICNDANLEAAQEPLSERFPFLEFTSLIEDKDPKAGSPDYLVDSISYCKNMKSPRFIKTHLPFKLLPKTLQQNKTSAKIVYIARNSLDVCVSYFHHCKLLEGYHGDFDTFCDVFLQESVNYGPFWDHVLGFWKQRNNPNVLFITYESLKKDFKSVVLKTANFLEKSISEDQIEKLLHHLSFDSMKKNRAVNNESLIERGMKFNFIKEYGAFMRCGNVGDSKNYMTKEMIKKFSEWDSFHLQDSDFKFSYN